MIIWWGRENWVKQMPRVACDEREQFIISRSCRKSEPSRRGSRNRLSVGRMLQYATLSAVLASPTKQVMGKAALQRLWPGRQSAVHWSAGRAVAECTKQTIFAHKEIVDILSDWKKRLLIVMSSAFIDSNRPKHSTAGGGTIGSRLLLRGTKTISAQTWFGSASSNRWQQPIARHVQSPLHKTVNWLQVQQDM
jgi:hypothetical protein